MTQTAEATIERARSVVFEMEINLLRQRRTAMLLRSLGELREVQTDALLPIAEYLEILNDFLKGDWDELRDALGLTKPAEDTQ